MQEESISLLTLYSQLTFNEAGVDLEYPGMAYEMSVMKGVASLGTLELLMWATVVTEGTFTGWMRKEVAFVASVLSNPVIGTLLKCPKALERLGSKLPTRMHSGGKYE